MAVLCEFCCFLSFCHIHFIPIIICIYICFLPKRLFSADPPPINSIRVDEVCSNDFTISWISTRDDTGLHFIVILAPLGQLTTTMDTNYNFTGLMPNTNYSVTVSTKETMACLGLSMVIMVTTVTKQAAVPRSELLLE